MAKCTFVDSGGEKTQEMVRCKEIVEGLSNSIAKSLTRYSFNGYTVMCFYCIYDMTMSLCGYHEDTGRPCFMEISISITHASYAPSKGIKTKIPHDKIIDTIEARFDRLKKL